MCIYVRISKNIRVFGVNALTQDKEVTNKYTFIYERIQAIRAYTCKKKGNFWFDPEIECQFSIRTIHSYTGNTMYTYYTGYTYIYTLYTRIQIYTYFDHGTSTYIYVRIRKIHTIREIRFYTHIYMQYNQYVQYRVYIHIHNIHTYTDIYVLRPRDIYVHIRTYT